jgi:hypothetical protein
VLAQQQADEAQCALAGLRSQPAHLRHVLVVAAKFLTYRGRVLRLHRDHAARAQHDQQMTQRRSHAGWMARTRGATAARQMPLEEFGDELLVDVRAALAVLLHPHRQVRHGRFAAAHVAGGVAAIEQVLAVRLCMPLQPSNAAGVDGRNGSRKMLGAHGGLQVVERQCTC